MRSVLGVKMSKMKLLNLLKFKGKFFRLSNWNAFIALESNNDTAYKISII